MELLKIDAPKEVLKKCVKEVWRRSLSENKAVLKKALNMAEGKSLFQKKNKTKTPNLTSDYL